MRNTNRRFSVIYAAVLIVLSFAFSAAAQTGGNSGRTIELVNKINAKLTDLQYNINAEVNGNSISQSEETMIGDLLRNLRRDLEDFQQNARSGRESKEGVDQILSSASDVNETITKVRFNAKTKNDWQSARNLLDQLASDYGTSANWTVDRQPVTNVGFSDNGLTGTYELDASRSDNIQQIADEAIRSSTAQNRDDAKSDLESRLESPQNIAIDLRGKQVVIASSLTQQITFSADGRDQAQTLSDGTEIRVRTTLRGQELTIASLGNNNDYTVVFSSIDNGNSLKVTRRITTDYLSQTVFAESVYTKSEPTARLDIYENQTNTSSGNSTGNFPPTTTVGTNPGTTSTPPVARTPKIGQYVVRNGEIITGTLENMVSTKVSQNNDRFRLRVSGPNEYRGAIIEGYVSGIDRSNRNPVGKAKLTFNFETITLSNGETFDFAGFLQAVTDDRGKTIKVDEEGAAQKSSTKETLKRGGIGAGAGALLGAIFGGAKGAIIGATIGAGAGAGSVAIQNNGELELKEGSMMTVQSSSPIN